VVNFSGFTNAGNVGKEMRSAIFVDEMKFLLAGELL
jgi:hypothetical protein